MKQWVLLTGSLITALPIGFGVGRATAVHQEPPRVDPSMLYPPYQPPHAFVAPKPPAPTPTSEQQLVELQRSTNKLLAQIRDRLAIPALKSDKVQP